MTAAGKQSLTPRRVGVAGFDLNSKCQTEKIYIYRHIHIQYIVSWQSFFCSEVFDSHSWTLWDSLYPCSWPWHLWSSCYFSYSQVRVFVLPNRLVLSNYTFTGLMHFLFRFSMAPAVGMLNRLLRSSVPMRHCRRPRLFVLLTHDFFCEAVQGMWYCCVLDVLLKAISRVLCVPRFYITDSWICYVMNNTLPQFNTLPKFI